MTPRAATYLIFVVNGAVVGTWIASIPAIQSKLDLSGTQMGLVLLTAALGALVAQQITGQLLVRVSSRALVTATSAVFPLLVVPLLLAPSGITLAAAIFFFGAFNTAMDAAMNAHGVALEDSGGRSILSGLHAGWSIGGVAGASAVAVAVALGIDPVVEAVIAAALLWCVAMVASRFLGDGWARSVDAGRGIHWPSRSVLPIAILVLLAAVVEGGLADWGGIYMRQGAGSDAGTAALAYAALSLGLFLGRLGGDRVKDRIGSVRMIEGGALLAGLATIAFLVLGHPLVALLGMILAGIGIANAIPQLFGAAGRIRPNGPSLTAAFTSLTLGFMIGPVVIGTATDTLGITPALGVPAVAALLTVVLVRRVPSAETNPRFRRPG